MGLIRKNKYKDNDYTQYYNKKRRVLFGVCNFIIN
ncbi:MAG: hypothetical protein H6Q17_311 [Bacteroidetes bacterium]|jgi:hypothetical protein|nr:hypothetical protein [Bacteroidota bacterium]